MVEGIDAVESTFKGLEVEPCRWLLRLLMMKKAMMATIRQPAPAPTAAPTIVMLEEEGEEGERMGEGEGARVGEGGRDRTEPPE